MQGVDKSPRIGLRRWVLWLQRNVLHQFSQTGQVKKFLFEILKCRCSGSSVIWSPLERFQFIHERVQHVFVLFDSLSARAVSRSVPGGAPCDGCETRLWFKTWLVSHWGWELLGEGRPAQHMDLSPLTVLQTTVTTRYCYSSDIIPHNSKWGYIYISHGCHSWSNPLSMLICIIVVIVRGCAAFGDIKQTNGIICHFVLLFLFRETFWFESTRRLCSNFSSASFFSCPPGATCEWSTPSEPSRLTTTRSTPLCTATGPTGATGTSAASSTWPCSVGPLWFVSLSGGVRLHIFNSHLRLYEVALMCVCVVKERVHPCDWERTDCTESSGRHRRGFGAQNSLGSSCVGTDA